uniref:Uncharacterized protein n=1 Tax=Mimivirus LCMiAC02 TaxID=2506609 RepID=A0A481Z1W9_9VIRU|nr:MAG: hypothetical protein LCMiAC02_01380 [Mimivirus LCMiAC02]
MDKLLKTMIKIVLERELISILQKQSFSVSENDLNILQKKLSEDENELNVLQKKWSKDIDELNNLEKHISEDEKKYNTLVTNLPEDSDENYMRKDIYKEMVRMNTIMATELRTMKRNEFFLLQRKLSGEKDILQKNLSEDKNDLCILQRNLSESEMKKRIINIHPMWILKRLKRLNFRTENRKKIEDIDTWIINQYSEFMKMITDDKKIITMEDLHILEVYSNVINYKKSKIYLDIIIQQANKFLNFDMI